MNILLRTDRVRMRIAVCLSAFLLFFPLESRLSYAIFVAMTFYYLTAILGVHQRVSPFEAALPIEGRALSLARLRIIVKAIWRLAALGAVLLVICLEKLWVPGLLLLLEAAAVSTVVVLILRRIRPEVIGVAIWSFWLLWPALAVPAYFLPATLVLLACALATGILLRREMAQAPQAYQLAPADAVGPSLQGRFFIPVACRWQPLIGAYLGWDTVFPCIYPLTFFNSELLLVSHFVLMAFLSRLWKQSPWVLSLPISRRKLFLTACMFFVIAITAADSFRRWEDSRSGLIHLGYGSSWKGVGGESGKGTRNVQVPFALWRRAPDGIAPAIQAPWGEQSDPVTVDEIGFRMYNPYSVAPTNSAEFLDWQFQRATLAIYGAPVPVSQYPNLKQLALTPSENRWKPRVIAIAAISAWGLAYFAFQFAIRPFPWYRRRVIDWLVHLAPLVVFLVFRFTSSDRYTASFTPLALSRLTAALPQNSYAAVAAVLSLLGAAYLLAERQFVRQEAYFERTSRA